MKLKKYFLNIPLLFIIFYLSCSPDEKSLTAPFDKPDNFLRISNFQIGSSQLVANIDTTTVAATILNSNDEPVSGIRVEFTATTGEVIYSDTSSSALSGMDGKASAEYVPGADYGENSLYVSAGAAMDTLTVTISPQELTLIVTPSETEILGDGEAETDLTISMIDQYSGALPGLEIQCSTDHGMLSDESMMTDADGLAMTTLTSTGTVSDVDATVSCQLTNDETIAGTAVVKFTGLTLEVTTEAEFFESDQGSILITGFMHKTTTGEPVFGEIVNWMTSQGTIDQSSQTDADGIATAQLIPIQGQTGEVTVTASVGTGEVSGSANLYFVAQSISSIELLPGTDHILADGVSSLLLTATALDEAENPAAFVNLQFSTGQGHFADGTQSISVLTDGQGSAVAELISAASVNDVDVSVSAFAEIDPNVIANTSVRFRGITFSITSQIDTLIADGTTVTEITAQARETSNGNPLENQTVYWSTTMGVILGSSETNSFGFTSTQLMSSYEDGHAVIEAALGDGISDTLEFEFVTLSIAHLDLTASESSIVADGITGVDIDITAVDEVGNPIDGATIALTTEQGTFENGEQSLELSTGGNGSATVTLTGPASSSDLMSAVHAAALNNETIAAELQIGFRGISFSITSDFDALIADGETNTPFYALVKETTNGNAVSNATVNWATTMGVITAESQTSSLGVAHATLVSSYETGEAVISATFGNELSDDLSIQFVESGVYDVSFTSYQNSIPADGVSTITFTALATDAIGVPIENSPVEFATGNGSFNNGQQTYQTSSNPDGIVYGTLSGIASAVDVHNLVSVTAINNPAVNDTMTVTFRGITITITTEVDTLIADGETVTNLSALVTETTSLSPITGEDVYWSTTLGQIDDSSLTDQFGIATAQLTSSPLAGSSVLEAHLWGGLSDDLQIEFIPLAIASIAASASATTIYADGASTATFSVTAYDERGHIMQGEPIHFTTDLGLFTNGEEEIEINTDEDGVATAVLTSTPSSSDISASVYIYATNDPTIFSAFDILLRGITIYIDSEVDTLLADINTVTPITAYVVETSTGNPVVGGNVTWSTTLGQIPEISYTNDFGETTAELISSDEVGLAEITALFGSCGTDQENCLSASISCYFVGYQIPTYLILTAGSPDDNQDGTVSTPITAILTDQNSYGIANYNINFSVLPNGWGVLEPPSDMTNASGLASTNFIWDSDHAFESVVITATAYSETGDVTSILPLTLTLSRGN